MAVLEQSWSVHAGPHTFPHAATDVAQGQGPGEDLWEMVGLVLRPYGEAC